jgi:hypothetical protein
MTQPTLWNFPQLLQIWCAFLCPELALVLSIWLSSGRRGLLLHWRASLRTACRAERISSERRGVRV